MGSARKLCTGDKAGFCSEIIIVLQKDGSATVADNGRGIPIQAMPNSTKTPVQTVLTEIGTIIQVPLWLLNHITDLQKNFTSLSIEVIE